MAVLRECVYVGVGGKMGFVRVMASVSEKERMPRRKCETAGRMRDGGSVKVLQKGY